MLTEDHPKPDDLVAATRGTIERTRKFLIDKKIVTVPSEVRPTIAETPPFMRTGGFASMDTPGAYETKATEAFYYVTPPEKEWDVKRKVEHMRQFNKTGMDVITIHEAYPGHYLQFLYAKQYPTKVRKLYTCGTNVEGWAHYAEQMIVEEGYGDGDPKVRLAQLERGAAARLPVRRRHQAAHGRVDGRAGEEVLRRAGVSSSRRWRSRSRGAARTTRRTCTTRWASCRSSSSATTTRRRRVRSSACRSSTTTSCSRAACRSS